MEEKVRELGTVDRIREIELAQLRAAIQKSLEHTEALREEFRAVVEFYRTRRQQILR